MLLFVFFLVVFLILFGVYGVLAAYMFSQWLQVETCWVSKSLLKVLQDLKVLEWLDCLGVFRATLIRCFQTLGGSLA